MASNDELVNVGRSLNQQISQLVSVFGDAFPVGGANAKLKSYTVAGVPSASATGAGTMIYVTDETGGAVPAFSDGSDWRRVTDRNVIS